MNDHVLILIFRDFWFDLSYNIMYFSKKVAELANLQAQIQKEKLFNEQVNTLIFIFLLLLYIYRESLIYLYFKPLSLLPITIT